MNTALVPSKILFYDEKKSVIVNILDTAVKTLEFDQKSYMQVKSQLMHAIETPGNERVGLHKIVTLTNQMIAEGTQEEIAEGAPMKPSQPMPAI